jgi:hypothetical protein
MEKIILEFVSFTSNNLLSLSSRLNLCLAIIHHSIMIKDSVTIFSGINHHLLFIRVITIYCKLELIIFPFFMT